MAKNKKVMSIAIKPELHEELKRYATRKVMSASAYVGDLIEKAMKLNVDEDPIIVGKSPDEDVKCIVLKIPNKLRENREDLQRWMDVQSKGIVSQLTKGK
jgi:hypothetical protein